MTGAVRAGFTRSWRVIYMSILLVFSIVLSSCGSGGFPQATTIAASDNGAIHVIVTDEQTQQEIEDDVVVLVQTVNPLQADDNDNDTLRLPFCSPGQYIYAWAPGYYINEIQCDGRLVYEIPLTSYHAADNPNYIWIDADIRFDPSHNCASCHSTMQGRTEYLEWNKDGHSKVFVNPYFWTMYLGMDINRNQGFETTWQIFDNGERLRLPNTSIPGPGFRLDYPNDGGNCGYCHAPAAVNSLSQEPDLTPLIKNSFGAHINVETEGITCDVCHKVTDVVLGNDRLPYVDRPGVLSMAFIRPASFNPFSIGPRAYDLNQDPEAMSTCSPVFSESKFCAACHYGKFSDVEIYSSYKEWLESLYSHKYIDSGSGNENRAYRSCQDCHMLSPGQIGDTVPSARAACTKTNLNFPDFSHNMMKYGPDPDNPSREIPLLIREAATLTIQPIMEEGNIEVQVMVENTGAGHKFPTDSPLRHLILLVEAKDRNGTLLAQVAGPTIPMWGGVGNQADHYAGRPGQIYANILKDKDTNFAPTVAYWNPTEPISTGSDTRLLPRQPVLSQYAFATPAYGPANIEVKLIYRYAFIDLARQKGWDRPDILVTSQVWECTRFTDPPSFGCEQELDKE